MATRKYSLLIDSNLDNLPRVEEFIIEILQDMNLDSSILNNLLLSVNEATNNSVIHGNKSDLSKNIEVTIEIDGECIIISVRDQGAGFAPEEVPDPTAPENLLKDSGRGLYIMRSCMDEIRYIFHEDGTELQMKIKTKKPS